MIHTSEGTRGSVMFRIAVGAGLQGVKAAEPIEIRRLQARRIRTLVANGLQPLCLIALQARRRPLHCGTTGLVVAAEMLVELAQPGIAADQLFDPRLRLRAIETLRDDGRRGRQKQGRREDDGDRDHDVTFSRGWGGEYQSRSDRTSVRAIADRPQAQSAPAAPKR